ncbi:unnamed protein product, partial [marine sediment metagenome]
KVGFFKGFNNGSFSIFPPFFGFLMPIFMLF